MVQATAYIVKEKGSPFERITVELEEIQSQEVLVDLQATGICHTDLAVQHGKIPMPFPVILGHEGLSKTPLLFNSEKLQNNRNKVLE